MEYDEPSARKLLEELDEDKSGLIDFQEFCAFIARVKYVYIGLSMATGVVHNSGIEASTL